MCREREVDVIYLNISEAYWRTTERLRLAGTSADCLVQPLLKAGSAPSSEQVARGFIQPHLEDLHGQSLPSHPASLFHSLAGLTVRKGAASLHATSIQVSLMKNFSQICHLTQI